jgi:5-methylcytosine-specific restriction endonuclease McrA
MLSDEERREQDVARVRAWRAANSEKRRASDRARYAANPQKYRAARSAWYAANIEKRRAYQRAWAANQRAIDAEKVNAKKRARRAAQAEQYAAEQRAYFASDPEKWRAYHRAYKRARYAANPNEFLERVALRRARYKEATADAERVSRQNVYDRDEGRCYLCDKPVAYKAFHLEHIVPLAKGGAHVMANVATACGPCNRRKNAALPSSDTVPAYARAYVHRLLAAAGEPLYARRVA